MSKDNSLILLKDENVINWLVEDLSFLESQITRKNKTKDINTLKKLEDEWGRSIMKKKRPDLKLDKQWTGNFGQDLVKEILITYGKDVFIPKKKSGFQPDLETYSHIIECKTQTYFTTGTAGEKILGVPFKYRNIPKLYGKPLLIICMGGAEKLCKETYGILEGDACDETASEMLNFYKEKLNIEYIGYTELIERLKLNDF
jgi:hypothetical protein